MRDATAPITALELSREKAGLILSLPADFATAAQVRDRYKSLLYYGLPLDYYNSYVENVDAITQEQATAAAKAHLEPEKLRLLIVGDGAQVLPGIYELVAKQTLGPGDLVILDADGAVLEVITPTQAVQRLGSKP
jgi:zinc protease